LDSATREQINATIGSIRRGLTAHLFPVLTESGGYIAAETRATITHVVGAIAADISDARAVLEHTSTPAV
jgi:hypothetical protein